LIVPITTPAKHIHHIFHFIFAISTTTTEKTSSAQIAHIYLTVIMSSFNENRYSGLHADYDDSNENFVEVDDEDEVRESDLFYDTSAAAHPDPHMPPPWDSDEDIKDEPDLPGVHPSARGGRPATTPVRQASSGEGRQRQDVDARRHGGGHHLTGDRDQSIVSEGASPSPSLSSKKDDTRSRDKDYRHVYRKVAKKKLPSQAEIDVYVTKFGQMPIHWT
jgi:hypothetical protein